MVSPLVSKTISIFIGSLGIMKLFSYFNLPASLSLVVSLFIMPRIVSFLFAEDFVGKPSPIKDLSKHLKFIKGEPAEICKGRVTVLEFWATWCPPCKKSIPHLSELYDRFSAEPVDFVGISREDETVVSKFVEGLGNEFRYPVAIEDGVVSSSFGVSGIPVAFVICGEGTILWQGHPMQGLDTALETALHQPESKLTNKSN